MSSATATADPAQTSDRTAAQACRILAVAPVNHPGGAETGPLGGLQPRSGGRAGRVLHVHDIVARVPAMWRRAELRKGTLDLVHAAPAIRRGAPGARIVVIGSDPCGSDPAYLRAVTGSAEVEHHPWLDNAAGIMRHLDVLVLPSRRQPFGTVLAEAMTVGTPVVATRVDGLADVERLIARTP